MDRDEPTESSSASGAADRATAQAWRELQARLADRLAELEVDDVLVVDALVGDEPDDGAAPYVQFCAWGEGMLRGEVASDHVLGSAYELHAGGRRTLLTLGYDAPTYGPDDEPDAGSLNFHVDLPQAQADRLAVMAVGALRDAFGVVHPALLSGDVVPAAPHEPDAVERMQGEEQVATFPRGGHEELTELVDAALTPYFGHPPRHDDDGDIPVELGSTVLFVRVCETVPVVELFACVAVDVQDLERAAFEVTVLNRDVRYVKFRLVGDSILADLQLHAWPFVPEQLRAMLAVMSSAVEEVGSDLQARVGGHALLGDPDVDLEDHPGQHDDDPGDEPADALIDDQADALIDDQDPGDGTDAADGSDGRMGALGAGQDRAVELLAELEAETAGSVSPELAASVCGHDATRILDLIRNEQRERLEWCRLRDETAGVDDFVEVGCEHEIAHSDRMISLLRRALRVVVEHQAARDEAAAPRTTAVERTRPARERPARRPRPRPRCLPDPTIEEVDPEIWS